MDATDFAIGIAIMGILVWISLIVLNMGSVGIAISDLYVIAELNKPLISLEEVCPSETGFELVEPRGLEIEPYHVLAGVNDFNQTYFCFYRKLEQESG